MRLDNQGRKKNTKKSLCVRFNSVLSFFPLLLSLSLSFFLPNPLFLSLALILSLCVFIRLILWYCSYAMIQLLHDGTMKQSRASRFSLRLPQPKVAAKRMPGEKGPSLSLFSCLIEGNCCLRSSQLRFSSHAARRRRGNVVIPCPPTTVLYCSGLYCGQEGRHNFLKNAWLEIQSSWNICSR